eukprot:CAMPEP_0172446342 /NCGR_PEP_ID=MMETSP1065-20121228/5961_1 /TAXON_ID=265537 /ORGANISM="Amphiprora paludosa, Strain CCMP125" /LENGTH=299 /DNA_ID=CAMNT_0013197431 /DNA_START=44 /DNA_END=943 /DNA_ORIENTATION=+
MTASLQPRSRTRSRACGFATPSDQQLWTRSKLGRRQHDAPRTNPYTISNLPRNRKSLSLCAASADIPFSTSLGSFLESPALSQSTVSSSWTTLTVGEIHATVEPATSFEPVLNVPALSVFLFIAIVFGFLQYRIAAIGQAADRRTEALQKLRQVKSWQLAGARGDDVDEATVQERVEQATLDYQIAYYEVERLRTVIPGVARIAPPPADSNNRERTEENIMAAQQFLNVTLADFSEEELPSQESAGLSPAAVAVLLTIATAQILLLVLLTMDNTPSMGLLDSSTSPSDVADSLAFMSMQ